MRVIAFIEDEEVIKKILKELNLWDINRKPRPVATAPPPDGSTLYDDAFQPRSEDYVSDPDLCASGALSTGIILLTRIISEPNLSIRQKFLKHQWVKFQFLLTTEF